MMRPIESTSDRPSRIGMDTTALLAVWPRSLLHRQANPAKDAWEHLHPSRRAFVARRHGKHTRRGVASCALGERPNPEAAAATITGSVDLRRTYLWGRLRVALRLRGLYLLRAEIRFVPTEAQRLFALTMVIGVWCGLAAVAFHLAITLASRALIEHAMAAPGSLVDRLDDRDADAGRSRVRHPASVRRPRRARQRHPPGEGRLRARRGPPAAARLGRQVLRRRAADRLGLVARPRGPDGADLRGRRQRARAALRRLAAERCAASSRSARPRASPRRSTRRSPR